MTNPRPIQARFFAAFAAQTRTGGTPTLLELVKADEYQTIEGHIHELKQKTIFQEKRLLGKWK
jgi:hypothetical protein